MIVDTSTNTKIAVNTVVLYARLAITVVISLYTTRLVLNALGAVDYGIFNLVAGVIAMLSFLNGALSISTQRYLSFYQGKNDVQMQREVFANSFTLHAFIGVFLVIVLEMAALFLFDGFLNIPENRINAAKVIYHFMSATVFFTVLSVPFNGSLTAHENMFWVAIVNIVEALLKLVIAVLLLRLAGDRLVLFGMLTATISAISFVLYATYCTRRYNECKINSMIRFNANLLKELSLFAVWNLFGALCSIGRTSGIAIVLNLFFGAIINSSYGIANQVASQLSFFSTTLMRAINPQIMKSEGAGDRKRMIKLSGIAGKFSFFLFSFFLIPLFIEMPLILKIWLKEVPDQTVLFCRLILLISLVQQISLGIMSAIQAIGNIKFYQFIAGSIQLLTLPIGYLLFNFGYPSYAILIVALCIEIGTSIFRVLYFTNITSSPLLKFIKELIIAPVVPFGLTLILIWLVHFSVNIDLLRLFLVIVLSPIAYTLLMYYLGITKEESEKVSYFIENVKSRIMTLKTS